MRPFEIMGQVHKEIDIGDRMLFPIGAILDYYRQLQILDANLIYGNVTVIVHVLNVFQFHPPFQRTISTLLYGVSHNTILLNVNLEGIIMPVAMGVRARAEYLEIFLIAIFGIIKPMAGGKSQLLDNCRFHINPHSNVVMRPAPTKAGLQNETCAITTPRPNIYSSLPRWR
jgi:hypothetical protein